MQVPELALEAAQLIDRIERLARSGVPVRSLNPAQWEALRYLARANRFSRTPAGLAAYFGSTRGTVSQTLIALEEKGFVIRKASEKDRRFVDLGLTAKGLDALAEDPLLGIAGDIAEAAGTDVSAVVDMLRRALRSTVRRNGGRPFGVCRTCRHFRGHGGLSPERGGFCELLKQPLSEADGDSICLEQEDA